MERTTTFCKLTVSDLFHSPLGVLFTFPSRYLFAIGDQGYLGLEGGPPDFPQDFSCPVVLRKCIRRHELFVYGAITLYDGPSQGPSTKFMFCNFLKSGKAISDASYDTAMT